MRRDIAIKEIILDKNNMPAVAHVVDTDNKEYIVNLYSQMTVNLLQSYASTLGINNLNAIGNVKELTQDRIDVIKSLLNNYHSVVVPIMSGNGNNSGHTAHFVAWESEGNGYKTAILTQTRNIDENAKQALKTMAGSITKQLSLNTAAEDVQVISGAFDNAYNIASCTEIGVPLLKAMELKDAGQFEKVVLQNSQTPFPLKDIIDARLTGWKEFVDSGFFIKSDYPTGEIIAIQLECEVDHDQIKSSAEDMLAFEFENATYNGVRKTLHNAIFQKVLFDIRDGNNGALKEILNKAIADKPGNNNNIKIKQLKHDDPSVENLANHQEVKRKMETIKQENKDAIKKFAHEMQSQMLQNNQQMEITDQGNSEICQQQKNTNGNVQQLYIEQQTQNSITNQKFELNNLNNKFVQQQLTQKVNIADVFKTIKENNAVLMDQFKAKLTELEIYGEEQTVNQNDMLSTLKEEKDMDTDTFLRILGSFGTYDIFTTMRLEVLSTVSKRLSQEQLGDHTFQSWDKDLAQDLHALARWADLNGAMSSSTIGLSIEQVRALAGKDFNQILKTTQQQQNDANMNDGCSGNHNEQVVDYSATPKNVISKINVGAFTAKTALEHVVAIKYFAHDIVGIEVPDLLQNKGLLVAAHTISGLVGALTIPGGEQININIKLLAPIISTVFYGVNLATHELIQSTIQNKIISEAINGTDFAIKSFGDFVTKCGVEVFLGAGTQAAGRIAAAMFGAVSGAVSTGLQCYAIHQELSNPSKMSTTTKVIVYTADVAAAAGAYYNFGSAGPNMYANIQKWFAILDTVVATDYFVKLSLKTTGPTEAGTSHDVGYAHHNVTPNGTSSDPIFEGTNTGLYHENVANHIEL
ncbi:hypothetical protein MIDIC_470022 [Alphaproteobacteria bacterium]